MRTKERRQTSLFPSFFPIQYDLLMENERNVHAFPTTNYSQSRLMILYVFLVATNVRENDKNKNKNSDDYSCSKCRNSRAARVIYHLERRCPIVCRQQQQQQQNDIHCRPKPAGIEKERQSEHIYLLSSSRRR